MGLIESAARRPKSPLDLGLGSVRSSATPSSRSLAKKCSPPTIPSSSRGLDAPASASAASARDGAATTTSPAASPATTERRAAPRSPRRGEGYAMALPLYRERCNAGIPFSAALSDVAVDVCIEACRARRSGAEIQKCEGAIAIAGAVRSPRDLLGVFGAGFSRAVRRAGRRRRPARPPKTSPNNEARRSNRAQRSIMRAHECRVCRRVSRRQIVLRATRIMRNDATE